jgi:hypothetical protein
MPDLPEVAYRIVMATTPLDVASDQIRRTTAGVMPAT